MRTRRLAVCIVFLVLSTIGTSAQDTQCENFSVETIACNEPPHNSCSSRTSLDNVIVGYVSGGCNHTETETLSCPNNSSCPATSYYSVSVANPYCTQFCGCGGECCSSGGCCINLSQCSQDGSGGQVCDTCACQCVAGSSPIIIDTMRKGFHLTSPDAGVVFDIRGDGRPIKLAWTAVDSGNAFLALDRNGNGRIDNGKELFGNYTAQPKSASPNGYLALAEFDKPENGGNDNGMIDPGDEVYKKLLLWIDVNHDGISQPNELHSLAEMGVETISLNYTDLHYADQYGNLFHYRAAVNPGLSGDSRDGRWCYDVFFVPAQNPTGSNCPAKKGPDNDVRLSLPDNRIK